MQYEKPSSTLPVAVTMGCPAGIGPEIALAALSKTARDVPCVVVGDAGVLSSCIKKLGLDDIHVRAWEPGNAISRGDGVINCLDKTRLSFADFTPGQPSKTTGMASYQYIIEAVKLCQSKQAIAVVTAPISKTGLNLAGIPFPGHTEILAHRTGTSDYLMMMAGERLKVTLATIHVPLSTVPDSITKRGLLKTIKLTWRTLSKDFGIRCPRLAVCGLNPHAGEGGMFGDEEKRLISPACKAAREEGMDIAGPLPPDTVFYHAAQGKFDAVVCMYHDQGLIPFKLIHFRDGVNVTCGLPIVRTSVDHGTAYDIAWQGKASHESMAAAIMLAREIHENRMKSQA